MSGARYSTPVEAYAVSAQSIAEELVCGPQYPLTLELDDLWNRFVVALDTMEQHPNREEFLGAIQAALARANVDVSAPLAPDPDPSREIALELGSAYERAWETIAEGTEGVDGTVWKPGGPGDRLGPYDIDNVRAKVPTWFNVDAASLEERFPDPEQRADHVLGLLGTLCFGLSREAVLDLLTPDERPDVKKLDRSIRLVVMRQFTTHHSSDGALGTAKAGTLTERTVELCVGHGWLITVWHRALDQPAEPAPLSQLAYERTRDGVKERWERHGRGESAQDLGVFVMREIVDGYRDARRQLYTWLDEWDRQEFYERQSSSERETLRELRRQLTHVRQDIVAISHGEELTASHAWFVVTGAVDEARELARGLERTLEDLRYFSDALRTSFELLATTSTAETLTLTDKTLKLAEENRALRQQDSERLERLQRSFAFVTIAVLGPTVVGTLLGVNKAWVPGPPWLGVPLIFVLSLPWAGVALVLARSQRFHRWTDRLVRGSEKQDTSGGV